MKNILITGGMGFIGSHVVEHFAEKYPEYNIVVMDCLTYAADIDFYNEIDGGKYPNVKTYLGDITEPHDVQLIFNEKNINSVIHLAAESHVDNSIESPLEFAQTNVLGTLNLLNAAKEAWKDTLPKAGNVFYHISTDEVYGHLGLNDHPFVESTSYDPRSPYSASKAASDHFVRAFYHTHGLPTVISNCSNNYGPRQNVEKLLPKTITNLLTGKKIPVYGKGENIRDWLYVKDHVEAIDVLFHNGVFGETYNIGGDSEERNIDIVKTLIEIHILTNPHDLPQFNTFQDFIEFVEDRKGHDFRYAIDHEKITEEFGWRPTLSLREGLHLTYDYYKNKLDKDIRETR